MTKIKHNFYQVKSKSIDKTLSKHFYLLVFPILFFTLGLNAQRTWDMGNNTTLWPANNATAITGTVVVDGLTEVGGSSFGTTGPLPLTWTDGYTSTQEFRSGGSSSGFATNKPTTRYFTFPVTGPTTVKVWFRVNGTGGRKCMISDGTNPLGELTDESSTKPLFLSVNYTGGAGTIYIFSNASIDYFKIVSTDATIWDGTTWTPPVAPTSTQEAIIDGSYSTTSNGAISAKKLTVNSGKTLTINTGTNVTVQNEVINNGTLVIENNANLVQVNNVTNTGNVVVKRNSSALSRLDYTLWSSPVAGQNLAAFSPLTSLSPIRFYTYNTTYNTGGVSGIYTAVAAPVTTNFAVGTGYLIRMPNTAVAAPATETFNGQFTGVPNNGDIPVTMTDGGAGLRFNLVGNPYPSPITISSFVADNTTITGTLYFWRKTNGTGTAYCTVTGGTFVSNGNTQSVNPAGIIQTGQGFIVQANGSGTSLIFKNTQRATNNAGQFFKIKQVAAADKVWLNAVNAAGDFSQTAVTYSADGTQGVDNLDGKYIDDSSFALTSNISNEEYTIQGRPSFDASDVVPLNFKTIAAGDYTISIDHAEGVFAAGQDVILVDNTTGAETSLKSGSYTFTASAGVSNSRFALKYEKTLGTNDVVYTNNDLIVYKNKGIVTVNSSTETIAAIKVYDIQGRLLAGLKNIKSTTASIGNLKGANQILVVQVVLENGTVVTKKVVN